MARFKRARCARCLPCIVDFGTTAECLCGHPRVRHTSLNCDEAGMCLNIRSTFELRGRAWMILALQREICALDTTTTRMVSACTRVNITGTTHQHRCIPLRAPALSQNQLIFWSFREYPANFAPRSANKCKGAGKCKRAGKVCCSLYKSAPLAQLAASIGHISGMFIFYEPDITDLRLQMHHDTTPNKRPLGAHVSCVFSAINPPRWV